MKFVIAGASGFLGTALRGYLFSHRHQVTQLVRTAPATPEQVQWDPYTRPLQPSVLEGADAVINLAGASIGHWPWTASYRDTLLQSRVVPTETIAEAIAKLDSKPALVNSSAVGYYGDRGDEELDESSPPGEGFLAELVQRWEGATLAAREVGARVVTTRTGVVLDGRGGALRLMQVPFKVGLGGNIGSGRQWFPTIALDDYLAVVTRLAGDESLSGPFVVAAPVPATNADLTRALGRRLHRPTVLPAPTLAVRALLGNDLAGQLVGSLKVRPVALLAAGFEFAHPDLDSQLDAALGGTRQSRP
ncbi:MAG: TIGR01777 family oxidoreductase [Nocardioidaceae bacterium]